MYTITKATLYVRANDVIRETPQIYSLKILNAATPRKTASRVIPEEKQETNLVLIYLAEAPGKRWLLCMMKTETLISLLSDCKR